MNSSDDTSWWAWTAAIAAPIFMIVYLPFVMRRFRRKRQNLYDALGARLVQRGWKPSLGMPQRALGVLHETSFLMRASSTRFSYTCTYTFEAHGATLHLGVIGEDGGNRSVQDGTILVATVELRAPIACRISMEPIAPSFFEKQTVMRLTPSRGNRPCLFVHFPGNFVGDEPQVKEMLDLVDLLFGGAEKVLEGTAVALIGPSGFIVSGPKLCTSIESSAAVESFVQGAERLLDHCKELWQLGARIK